MDINAYAPSLSEQLGTLLQRVAELEAEIKRLQELARTLETPVTRPAMYRWQGGGWVLERPSTFGAPISYMVSGTGDASEY